MGLDNSGTGDLRNRDHFSLLVRQGKPAAPPELNLDTPAIAALTEKRCVEDAAFMRANHMKLLQAWRDESVREVFAITQQKTAAFFEKSLTGGTHPVPRK